MPKAVVMPNLLQLYVWASVITSLPLFQLIAVRKLRHMRFFWLFGLLNQSGLLYRSTLFWGSCQLRLLAVQQLSAVHLNIEDVEQTMRQFHNYHNKESVWNKTRTMGSDDLSLELRIINGTEDLWSSSVTSKRS